MDIYGLVSTQRAPSATGDEITYGPFYHRSASLKEITVSLSDEARVSWILKEEIREGTFNFSPNKERGCINVRRDSGRMFQASFLEKVRLADDNRPNSKEFHPVIRRLMSERRNWGVEFSFHGLSTFYPFLMEWTERMIAQHEHILKEGGIYGLVGISCLPFSYRTEVRRAFCELWSPLTNTFHHGGGEIGISLNDLKRIYGLSILGDSYEEYIPLNEVLLDAAKCPPTVVELLRIHTDLCMYHGTKEITWWKWLLHFYRGQKKYDASRENYRGIKIKPSFPYEEKRMPLLVSETGKLAAFLAFVLSRFVLPHGLSTVRPETFLIASFMAEGQQIALAPTVLGHIYHGLGEMSTYYGNPGRAKSEFWDPLCDRLAGRKLDTSTMRKEGLAT